LARLIHPLMARTWIRVLIVACEIETLRDERSANVGIVTDAVAMDDGICQRKRGKRISRSGEVPAAQRS